MENLSKKMLGRTVEIVRRPRKPASEEVLKAWAQQWAKEGVKVDWRELLPPKAKDFRFRRDTGS